MRCLISSASVSTRSGTVPQCPENCGALHTDFRRPNVGSQGSRGIVTTLSLACSDHAKSSGKQYVCLYVFVHVMLFYSFCHTAAIDNFLAPESRLGHRGRDRLNDVILPSEIGNDSHCNDKGSRLWLRETHLTHVQDYEFFQLLLLAPIVA